MSFEEFAAWLGQEMREDRMEEHQVADLLAQRLLFDRHREMIESEYRLKAVGYVANDRFIGDSVGALLDIAKRSPQRMLYFETIGYRFF